MDYALKLNQFEELGYEEMQAVDGGCATVGVFIFGLVAAYCFEQLLDEAFRLPQQWVASW